tara:strand:- start:6649 stop:7668 length:1020 start_codon:yes stop_codon:yes gene_type:complete
MADTVTEQIVRQAPFLEEFQKKLLESSFARGETPVDIPAVQVASLDPLTQQAMATAGGIGSFQDYITDARGTIGTGLSTLQNVGSGVDQLFTDAATQAAGTAQTFDPTGIASFMDPYQQAVTQNALAEMNRQAEIQRRALRDRADQVSPTRGSRFALQEAELGRNLADIQSRRIFEDLSRNYNQAQNAAQTAFENQQRRQQGVSQLLGGLGSARGTEAVRLGGGIAGLGTAQANLGGAGANLLSQQAQLESQLGAIGQTQAQRQLDAARQTQLQQAYEPFQRIGFMSDIFKPQIGSSASTLAVGTAPQPSPLSQAIGLGIGALGLNRALENPLGKLFGT